VTETSTSHASTSGTTTWVSSTWPSTRSVPSEHPTAYQVFPIHPPGARFFHRRTGPPTISEVSRARSKEGNQKGNEQEEKEKGVLQPIIVRPLIDFDDDTKKYEIVAGERRWRASAIAGALTIPAIIRELSDQEAFDIMVIENLQREDLDLLEEARAFETFASAGGDIEDLANRIGSDPRYIHRRVRILTLPEEVLSGWRDGKISLGHLEQLMRLSRKEDILEYYKETVDGYEQWSVADLRGEIDDRSPELSTALFDTGTCETCTMNTSMQGGIFGTDFTTEKVLCLNPKCFKEKQVDYLTEHWRETQTAAEFQTNGFTLLEDIINHADYSPFYSQHTEKLSACKECSLLVSIIDLSGRVRQGRACMGSKDCYRAVVSGKRQVRIRGPIARTPG